MGCRPPVAAGQLNVGLRPMRILRRITILGILSALFGKSSAAKPVSGVLRVEEGFLDIDLPITSVSKINGEVIRVTARGMIEDQVVGFAVDLYPAWKKQPLENSNAVFHWGTGSYRSIGNESDRFVALVAKHYD